MVEREEGERKSFAIEYMLSKACYKSSLRGMPGLFVLSQWNAPHQLG